MTKKEEKKKEKKEEAKPMPVYKTNAEIAKELGVSSRQVSKKIRRGEIRREDFRVDSKKD